MKKILSLTLGMALLASGGAALADDETISIHKAGFTTAKVSEFPGEKETSLVRIDFDSGASWDNVKDSYTVSDEVAEGLEHKNFTISIASDGTASFHEVMKSKVTKHKAMKK